MDKSYMVFTWTISIFALLVSYVGYKKNVNNAKAELAKREAEYNEAIARWMRGDLEGKWEPCISGQGEVFVIEPRLGHKMVVGSRALGESTFSKGVEG